MIPRTANASAAVHAVTTNGVHDASSLGAAPIAGFPNSLRTVGAHDGYSFMPLIRRTADTHTYISHTYIPHAVSDRVQVRYFLLPGGSYLHLPIPTHSLYRPVAGCYFQAPVLAIHTPHCYRSSTLTYLCSAKITSGAGSAARCDDEIQ